MFTGEYNINAWFLNQSVVISAWDTRTKAHLPALRIVTRDQRALQPTFAGHCYLHELPLQHMIYLYITWAVIERTCNHVKQGDIIAVAYACTIYNIRSKPEDDFSKHKPCQADPQEGLYLEELLMLLSSHMPNALSQPPIQDLRCKWK